MGIDLKRVYFSVTAFVVLLVAFFAAVGVFASVSAWVVLSTTPFEQRYPPGFMVQAGAPQGGTAPAVPAQTEKPTPAPAEVPAPAYPAKPGSLDDWELNNAREGLANSLAIVFLALPIWYFHWRRYRRLAHERQAFLMYRVYAYAFMVIALVTVIIAGGNVLTQFFRALLGVVDLATRYAQLTLIHQSAGSLLVVGWALLWWRYHWRAVEALPEPAGK